MKADSSPPKRIAALPAEVTLLIDNVGKPVVSFARKGTDSPIKLQVLQNNTKQIKVLLPEKLADCGPGIYTIKVMEGCEVCDEVDIEFTADCKITSVEVQEHNEDCPKC